MNRPWQIASLLAAVLTVAGFNRSLYAFTQGACQEDEKKYCADAEPGHKRDCMKMHEADLSPACKENVAQAKVKFEEKRKELEAACQADIKQYCANVTPGEGREMACLKAYSDKISAGCKEKLPKHGMHHMGMHHKDKP